MAEIRLLNSVGATVIIDGVERESVTVDAGTTVHWKVSKEGYVTQEGDYTVKENTVFPVVLKREEYTITFNVSPTDATLTVNGSAVALTDGKYTMTAKWGDTVSWSCHKDGYVSQSNSFTATQSETIYITLEEEVVARTITFVVTPTDATLTVNGLHAKLTDGKYVVTAYNGDVIAWSCERSGYVTQSGNHIVNGDATITVELEEEVAHYITVEPTSLELEANPRLIVDTVTVSSDGSWTAAAAASWVTLSQTSGEAGETAILVSAEENTSLLERTAIVTFTSEHGETATLNVSQNGASSGEGGDTGGGGGGGTTYTYTVVNNTSSDVNLGIYDSKGRIKFIVTVPANGTATFTTDEEITSETEFYVNGDVGTSYSVSVQGSTIYIDYGTSKPSDSDAQPSGDAEAYSEGGDGDELELSGE